MNDCNMHDLLSNFFHFTRIIALIEAKAYHIGILGTVLVFHILVSVFRIREITVP